MKLHPLLRRVLLTVAVIVMPVFAWASETAIPASPQLAAKSWILIDADSGRILAEQSSDQRLPPASLTKLMTSYIVTVEINRGQIKESDVVRISEKAWRTGGSRMFLDIGKEVSVDDLLHGIIIQSGNDASVAMAEHIAGSEEAFADRMNRTAAELGMKNSQFRNATGLPNPEHFSSPHDMATLARAIIRLDPVHYSIYAQKEFFWNGIKQPNRNLLLWRDKSVDGLKTGHTDEAGYCLVASAVREGQRLIAVVFGTANENARATETLKLLNHGFRFFETRRFYSKGTELAKVVVWKGSERQVRAGLAEDLVMTMPRGGGQMDRLQASLTLKNDVRAPIAAGQEVGLVEVRLDGEVVHSMPLVALDTVEEGGLLRRLWDSIRLFFAGLFS